MELKKNNNNRRTAKHNINVSISVYIVAFVILIRLFKITYALYILYLTKYALYIIYSFGIVVVVLTI